MIIESYVWKDVLKRDLRTTKKRIDKISAFTDPDEVERSYAALEKFVFSSAFVIRKLSESVKLSDELESVPIKVEAFARMNHDRPANLFTRFDFEGCYDFTNKESSKLTLRSLCNFLIHSFVFAIEGTSRGLSPRYLLFNSDRIKEKFIYRLSLARYFRLIEAVIQDDIIEMEVVHPFSNEMKIIKKSSKKRPS